MTTKIADIEDLLPLKPRAPNTSDCCGSGCCPCVHDIYEQDLKAWKKQCELIRTESRETPQSNRSVYPDKWKEFELTKITKIGINTFLYAFKLQENQSLGINVGQHLVVKQLKNDREVTRQYTPVSDIKKRGSFEVLIKIYANGKITSLIKDWKVGDLIPWRGPFGNFLYKANSYKRILMLAAGTGIAPMYQVIKVIVENEDDETFVKLYYASKNFSDVLLREELSNYCQYWNFTVCHYLSEETDMSQKRYFEEAIARKLSKIDVSEELMKGPLESTLVLICGTKSFDKDMINTAKDVKVPDKNIFKF